MDFNKFLEEANIEKEEIYMLVASLIGGVFIYIFNVLYISRIPGMALLSNVLNAVALVVVIVPPAMMRYMKYRRIKEMEERFPDFMREVVEGLRGGMSLPLSLKYASKADYGALNPLVKRMVAQISWGVPFETALKEFMKATRSRVIARAVSVIIEAHRSGGELAEAIDSVTKATVEVEKIKDERRSMISSQRTQGYLIFFIFIGIMIALQDFLLPSLLGGGATELGGKAATFMGGGMAVMGSGISLEEYHKLFLRMVLIQGFFSGLAIGKLAEGTFTDGLKHSLVLSITGYLLMVIGHGIFS